MVCNSSPESPTITRAQLSRPGSIRWDLLYASSPTRNDMHTISGPISTRCLTEEETEAAAAGIKPVQTPKMQRLILEGARRKGSFSASLSIAIKD